MGDIEEINNLKEMTSNHEETDKIHIEDILKGKKILIVLIGPPSVGKSGWLRTVLKGKEPYIVNRDDIVLKAAPSRGWTYRDAFKFPPPGSKPTDPPDPKYGRVINSPPFIRDWGEPVSYSEVLKFKRQIENEFQKTLANGVGKPLVVLDLTNMTRKMREKRNKLFSGYYKIAVVFPHQGSEHIIKEIASIRLTHTVPPEVNQEFMASFEMPSKSEGFDLIVKQDNREKLPTFLSNVQKQVAELKSQVKVASRHILKTL